MPRRSELRLSKREVDRLSVEGRDRVFWDSDLPGFGVRVYPTGRKIYVAQANSPTGVRRVSLGRHGTLTASDARKRAAAAIERIARGGNAEGKAPSPTVAALAERYMEAHVAVNCNANTRRLARGTLDNHILPALGELSVSEVGTAEVEALHYSLRATPRAANAMLQVLSKMFSLAEAWGVAAPRGNPCRHVIRYREGKRERFLTPDEYRRVGRALRELEAEGRKEARAAAALRLVMLTGCRGGEVVTLRWDDIDRKAGEIRLRDGKTGARMVPLTQDAAAVLERIHRVIGSPWLFPSRPPDKPMTRLHLYWYGVRERAGVEDVRIHDLRHSFASRALAVGESLSMIGRLLGHTDIASAARYAHLARDAERVSAARVGDSIEANILPQGMPTRADGIDAEFAKAATPVPVRSPRGDVRTSLVPTARAG